MMFKDRYDAAEKLLSNLQNYKSDPNAIILAIPRGALELGYVLAKGLNIPLDIILSKKIGFPLNPEYAIGAVTDQQVVLNSNFKDNPHFHDYIADQIVSIRKTLKDRNEKYRKGMAPLDLYNKTVIVVDDGVATGNTMLLTLSLIKGYKPKKIVVALPVSSKEALEKIEYNADEVVCLMTPENFQSVGQFYNNFTQVEDDEAIRLLREANS